ncbi:MAG: type II toxin-antitoxin system death-on-curing family toxin [Nitrospinaceae bacterium]
MKKEPVWVPKNVVLALHDALLSEHGGQWGLRDDALLDSALARPRPLLSYGDPNLFGLATAYVNGILRNHPFIDGNKRTGFMTGYVFLARNGKQLIAPEPQATQLAIGLAAGRMTEQEFTAWLEQNCSGDNGLPLPRGCIDRGDFTAESAETAKKILYVEN